ncbi:ATP-binding protein [Streptomyces uncialis]|uniref:ATP-binding protein n=1 Tax=Streptomyces uncialis TaxID=1048205 RepID=UPI003865E88E|nr:ATP-binding protein [Streptomyces uncialis]
MRAQKRCGGRTARVEFVLPGGSASAGRARQLTRALLAEGCGRPSDRLHDAQLVVSELVSNATRAARGPCRLRLRLDAHEFTVEVHDDSPERPSLRAPSASAESGRGLALVHALSRHWCVVGDRRGGKTVRAILALD